MRAQPPAGAPVECVATARGHFGEILQGRLGPGGPLALVTLPCPRFWAEARLRAGDRPLELVGPGAGPIAHAAALAAAEVIGRPPPTGRLSLETSAPIAAGAGSSTLSALTALRATVAASGASPLPPETEAEICLAAEGATDPLMFPSPAARLWAPRTARTLRDLPPPPKLWILGGFDGPGAPTDPADLAYPDVADLVDALVPALQLGDAARIGAVASASAARNQARNPKRAYREMAAFCDTSDRGAPLGLAVAHTGSAIGLLFAGPPETPDFWRARLTEIGLDAPFIAATMAMG